MKKTVNMYALLLIQKNLLEKIIYVLTIAFFMKIINMNIIIYAMKNVQQIHMLYFVMEINVKTIQSNVLMMNLRVII